MRGQDVNRQTHMQHALTNTTVKGCVCSYVLTQAVTSL